MFMPKTFNVINIYKLNVYAEDPSQFRGYAEDSQRHNHPSFVVMPKTVNVITIQVSWLCRRKSRA
jgi:hypothetical protein